MLDEYQILVPPAMPATGLQTGVNIRVTSPEVTTRFPPSSTGRAAPPTRIGSVLTPAALALARRAPTVDCSRGMRSKGLKRNSRIAFSWVILLIASSGSLLIEGQSTSGDSGQTESEC